MENRNDIAATTGTREVIITRVFEVERKLLFDAWRSPEHLKNWYAPNGCSIEIHEFNFSEGGRFVHSIIMPDGQECVCTGFYHKIDDPNRIVYSLSFSDKEGNVVEPDYSLHPEWPHETIVTVTFEDLNGRTRLTLHQTVAESLAKKTGAYPSWLQMLDRLEKEVTNT